MEGCEHPPEHKEAAVEEDAPAPPCEAWHRNGQWGDGSLLRQLCPPKPSLLPDPPTPPPPLAQHPHPGAAESSPRSARAQGHGGSPV